MPFYTGGRKASVAKKKETVDFKMSKCAFHLKQQINIQRESVFSWCLAVIHSGCKFLKCSDLRILRSIISSSLLMAKFFRHCE